MNRRLFLKSGLTLGAVAVVSRSGFGSVLGNPADKGVKMGTPAFKKVVKTDAEWKRLLTPEQYEVTRRQGTEAPYSSPLLKVHSRGVFDCVSCALPVFSSSTKFESNTGWPSFWKPIDASHVREAVDDSLGERRTDVRCARCDAHLGHVFNDGPPPTGLRYCMNGVAMRFVPSKAARARRAA